MFTYFQRFLASLLGNVPNLEFIWKLEKPIELEFNCPTPLDTAWI